MKIDALLSAASSVQYDACLILPDRETVDTLNTNQVVQWLSDAYIDLKAIGYSSSVKRFFKCAQLDGHTKGVIKIRNNLKLDKFIEITSDNRVWD